MLDGGVGRPRLPALRGESLPGPIPDYQRVGPPLLFAVLLVDAEPQQLVPHLMERVAATDYHQRAGMASGSSERWTEPSFALGSKGRRVGRASPRWSSGPVRPVFPERGLRKGFGMRKKGASIRLIAVHQLLDSR